jgi:hypothetical protein
LAECIGALPKDHWKPDREEVDAIREWADEPVHNPVDVVEQALSKGASARHCQVAKGQVWIAEMTALDFMLRAQLRQCRAVRKAASRAARCWLALRR